MFLEISYISKEKTYVRVSILIKLRSANLAQVLSCEFYEISKNTFFIEHLWGLLLYKVNLGIFGTCTFTQHKKWSFPLRTSSVNLTKSAVSWGFGHSCEEMLSLKLHFLYSDSYHVKTQSRDKNPSNLKEFELKNLKDHLAFHRNVKIHPLVYI